MNYVKLLIYCIFQVGTFLVFSQGNPGFLGKKIAIGYSSQYCALSTLNLDFSNSKSVNRRLLTNHDAYFEYALDKYSSISAVFSYQNVPLFSPYSNNGRTLVENVTMNGQVYKIGYEKVGGYSDFGVMGIGLKYSLFYDNKTISAPIGVSQYLRFDFFSVKALNNNYKYNIDVALTPEELYLAQSKINRKAPGVESKNVSLGYGIETKLILSRTLFIKFNGEFNLSSSLLLTPDSENFYSSFDNVSISDDLYNVSREITKFRNMFQFGFGIGVLL